jgi:RND family efflux transporter MFP subunit
VILTDKKALLRELTIDSEDRESKPKTSQYIVTGLTAIALGVAAWFWLFPQQEPLAVKTFTVQPAAGFAQNSGNTVLDASGYVTARRQATVSSKVTGKVNAVFIEEGISVAVGQLLATLDDSSERAQFNLIESQLIAAQAGQKEVSVQLHEARLTLKRTLELAADRLASQADLDSANLAVDSLLARLESVRKEIDVADYRVKLQQQRLDDLEIRAPFAGVVIAKAAQPGEMISPVSAGGGFTRTGICTIVDMDSLEIEVDVNEAYINRVYSGQPVTATLNSYQDWKIPAEVITIIPTADRNKATVRVRIAFLERDGRILPDMGVKVSFMEEVVESATPSQLSGVLVPTAAIARANDQNIVYVINDRSVNKREVKLGSKIGNQRNVLSGLKSGEIIVAEVSPDLKQQLADGSQVTIAN